MQNTESIHSYVRVRPDKDDKAVLVDGQKSVLVVKSKEHFQFQHAFSEAATNNEVYSVTTAKLLNDAYRGYNSCIFSYGQTCSGKTYTMKGNKTNPGIIPQLLSDLFQATKDPNLKWYLQTRISYLQIYNQTINDLFNDKNTNLQIRDNDRNPQVVNLTEFKVQTIEEAMARYEEGETIRKYSATGSNVNSSRSHAVFRVVVDSIEKDRVQVKNRAVINLIDLAGSEGIDRTKAEGIVKKQGENINKSLLTLSMVINGLGQKNQPFLPYRDSKLTRLLQGSLTGGSRIIVICNINPSHSNLTQTLSTLKFGVSAGQVKLSIKQNSTSQNQNQSTPQCDKMELSEDHEAELRRMSSKVEDLTMVITRKEEENEGYKADLERSRERVVDLEDTVRGLEEQVGELEKRLKVANSMLENSKVTTAGLKQLMEKSKTSKDSLKLEQQLNIIRGYNDKLLRQNYKLQNNQRELIKQNNHLQDKLKKLQSKYLQCTKALQKQNKSQLSPHSALQLDFDPLKLQDAMLLHVQILQRNKQLHFLRQQLQRAELDLQDADKIKVQYELHMKTCVSQNSQNAKRTSGKEEVDEKQVKVMVKKMGVYKKELSAKRKKEGKYMLMLKKANDRIMELEKEKYQIKCMMCPPVQTDLQNN